MIRPGSGSRFQDYVAVEEIAGVRHEFLDGHVWTMAGGSPEHGAIAANVIVLLGSQLRDRPCRVFTSDVRLRVQATGLATYPDVSVVCGQMQRDPDDPGGNTVLNPAAVVEVLSHRPRPTIAARSWLITSRSRRCARSS